LSVCGSKVLASGDSKVLASVRGSKVPAFGFKVDFRFDFRFCFDSECALLRRHLTSAARTRQLSLI